MTDHDLLLLRTAALNRVARQLGQVREMALDSKYRRGLVDADDILLVTDRRKVMEYLQVNTSSIAPGHYVTRH